MAEGSCSVPFCWRRREAAVVDKSEDLCAGRLKGEACVRGR